eukprot:337482-Chlamydomonas_euryale.AAC.5
MQGHAAQLRQDLLKARRAASPAAATMRCVTRAQTFGSWDGANGPSLAYPICEVDKPVVSQWYPRSGDACAACAAAAAIRKAVQPAAAAACSARKTAHANAPVRQEKRGMTTGQRGRGEHVLWADKHCISDGGPCNMQGGITRCASGEVRRMRIDAALRSIARLLLPPPSQFLVRT